MIDYKLHRETGILVVHPSGVLEAADFEKLSADVDASKCWRTSKRKTP